MNAIRRTVFWLSTVCVVAALFYQFAFQVSSEPVQSVRMLSDLTVVRSDTGTAVGSGNAKLTIVEYSDYGCGACQLLYEEMEDMQFFERYVNTGKIQFIFKDVPAKGHKNAYEASLAAQAAARQNAFRGMYKLLYENNKEWSRASDYKQVFEKYAAQLNLNMEQYRNDFDDSELRDSIKQTQKEFKQLDFPGTPVLIIGNLQINGTPTLQKLIAHIEEQLALADSNPK